jgi:hypothetical protein
MMLKVPQVQMHILDEPAAEADLFEGEMRAAPRRAILLQQSQLACCQFALPRIIDGEPGALDLRAQTSRGASSSGASRMAAISAARSVDIGLTSNCNANLSNFDSLTCRCRP